MAGGGVSISLTIWIIESFEDPGLTSLTVFVVFGLIRS